MLPIAHSLEISLKLKTLVKNTFSLLFSIGIVGYQDMIDLREPKLKIYIVICVDRNFVTNVFTKSPHLL